MDEYIRHVDSISNQLSRKNTKTISKELNTLKRQTNVSDTEKNFIRSNLYNKLSPYKKSKLKSHFGNVIANQPVASAAATLAAATQPAATLAAATQPAATLAQQLTQPLQSGAIGLGQPMSAVNVGQQPIQGVSGVTGPTISATNFTDFAGAVQGLEAATQNLLQQAAGVQGITG